MSLGLHSKCTSQLEKSLAENLRHVKVQHEMFLDFSSTLPLLHTNEVLPKTGKVYEHLHQCIGENPLYDFVYQTLSRELYENNAYSDESGIRHLSELPNYTDLNALAGRLVNEFESLPWPFLVTLELPDGVGKQFRTAVPSYSLTHTLRVVAPDESFDTKYPLLSGRKGRDRGLDGALSSLLIGRPRSWNKDTACIQIDLEGFIGRFGKTAPLERALGTIKAFVGLCLATRLMKVDEKQTTQSFGGPPKTRLIIHRQEGANWGIWSTYELPTDLSSTLNALEIDDIDGEIKPEQISGWTKNRLSKITTAFSNPGKAERVLLAAQWLLDSYVGANELLSFVQTTVAMEIMLGEESKSDVVGIGELLRNRCAYLIGKSHSQREKILADFNQIYIVRSKIVHRGKSRLSSEERTLFHELQWMCRRVISEELELIEKDEKK